MLGLFDDMFHLCVPDSTNGLCLQVRGEPNF